LKIEIVTIPHDQQVYPTVGDWRYLFHINCGSCGCNWDSNSPEPICPKCKSGTRTEQFLRISVSQLSSRKYEALIAIHELIEVILCETDGVTQEQVDQFDIAYEKDRQEGDESEPGDDEKAPYRDQHCFATGIERLLAARLGVCWKEYESELAELPWRSMAPDAPKPEPSAK
jgi:hypothetical protein